MSTWTPKVVKGHSRIRPDPDGAYRHHVCHGVNGINAVVGLATTGYRLGYDGEGWPLWTDNLQEALQRAELLLSWTDFEEAK